MEENKRPEDQSSMLERISDKLSVQGVDISNIVALSKYLDDAGVAENIRNASFDNLEGKAESELMEHLMPLLDEKSKTALFGKIIEGELDWHYLKIMMPLHHLPRHADRGGGRRRRAAHRSDGMAERGEPGGVAEMVRGH